MKETVLKAQNLTKAFGSFSAVNHIDFEIKKGDCFGFLGPNGAGKSTTIKMIYGALFPSEGNITIFGEDISLQRRAIKKRLGVVSQLDILEERLTAWENLYIHGGFFGMSRNQIREKAAELFKTVELNGRTKEPVMRYSGGMKRRLSIAKALINSPELLLLDEPTTGLDTQSRHKMWDFIHKAKQEGLSIFLTTHYMEEAEQLCDDLVIIDQGKILDRGSPAELIKKYNCRNMEGVFLHLTGRELRDD